VYLDLHRHIGKRNILVKQLIEKGIRDRAVLKAVGKVPRHLFLDSSFEDFAYQDKAFPIAAGQTISQPFTVAYQSELLQVKPGQRVLEVGTGSGYQSAVLCQMGIKVFSIERQKELFDHTRIIMNKLGYRLEMSFGDGYKGLPERAPFDGIVVTAGAPFIPPALVSQLKVGARLIIPVGEEVQKMQVLEKMPSGKVQSYEKGNFKFVPMLEKRT
jgi:protein-L-isoaspartate(D-aspartate) O-methyltransferase